MKSKTLILAALAAFATMLSAQTPTPPPPAANLPSAVFDWEKLPVIPNEKGVRRDVFDGPTATLDKAHCHITTLKPGENSGEPRKHLQEEFIVIKEGSIEATHDGKSETIGPGSVIFFAANAVTRLRNAGTTPATYIVFYFYTPRTPKS